MKLINEKNQFMSPILERIVSSETKFFSFLEYVPINHCPEKTMHFILSWGISLPRVSNVFWRSIKTLPVWEPFSSLFSIILLNSERYVSLGWSADFSVHTLDSFNELTFSWHLKLMAMQRSGLVFVILEISFQICSLTLQWKLKY